MVSNPGLLISVLDQLPEAKREEVFRCLSETGAADDVRVRAFDKAAAAEPMRPTSVTWKSLEKKCGTSLARLPNC